MKIGQAVSEELVGDFSEYSEFYKVSGDPVFQFLFCKVKISEAVWMGMVCTVDRTECFFYCGVWIR